MTSNWFKTLVSNITFSADSKCEEFHIFVLTLGSKSGPYYKILFDEASGTQKTLKKILFRYSHLNNITAVDSVMGWVES